MTVSHPLPDDLVELIAERFRALSEPTRIKLLDRLREGEATVLELTERSGRRSRTSPSTSACCSEPGSSPGESRATSPTTGSSTRASSRSAKPSAAACSGRSSRSASWLESPAP